MCFDFPYINMEEAGFSTYTVASQHKIQKQEAHGKRSKVFFPFRTNGYGEKVIDSDIQFFCAM